MVDKETCWYNINSELCINKMGLGLQTDYGKRLKKLIAEIPQGKTVDMGCGSGKSSMFFNNYTGVDLPEIIETIAKVVNPGLTFMKCDIIEDNIEFIKNYDIVHMDAFIDVMQYPLEVLDRVLNNCNKYVLLLRQEVIEGRTKVIKNPSYGGFTYHSEIDQKDLLNIFKKHEFSIVKEINCGIKSKRHQGVWKSYLLKR